MDDLTLVSELNVNISKILADFAECLTSALIFILYVLSFTETCLFGDVPFDVLFRSETCAQHVGSASNSNRCYTSSIAQDCCGTCGAHELANAHIPSEC